MTLSKADVRFLALSSFLAITLTLRRFDFDESFSMQKCFCELGPRTTAAPGHRDEHTKPSDARGATAETTQEEYVTDTRHGALRGPCTTVAVRQHPTPLYSQLLMPSDHFLTLRHIKFALVPIVDTAWFDLQQLRCFSPLVSEKGRQFLPLRSLWSKLGTCQRSITNPVAHLPSRFATVYLLLTSLSASAGVTGDATQPSRQARSDASGLDCR